VLAGLWVRSLRIAAEREAFARDMGGRTREMELFLRGAHSLPLHDVERERDVLRDRLREVERSIAAAGDVGVGPGNDALGRGHLALQDARAALEHFGRAEAAGYRAPGLDYAVGLALIELYRLELEGTARIQNAAEKAARVAEIERRYRDAALVRLRAALAQGIESPEYALGLVAHHEGRHEEALSHARRAFDSAPWLHEAKKLEGDVLFALGSRTRHDKAGFDFRRTMDHFERAAEAYRAAGEIARSDPQVHEAECELWIQAMNAAAEHGDSMSPHFDRAKAACERAISASPRASAGRVKLAWAHLSFAFWAVNGGQEGRSADEALARARERIEAALGQSPDDVFARYLSGAVWRGAALRDEQLGRDAGAAIDRAVAGYESALAKEPTFLWALNEQCGVLAMRGRREALLGVGPDRHVRHALARCKRAAELDPTFPFPAINTFLVWSYDLERRVAAGEDPKPTIERGLAAAGAGQASSSPWAAAFVAELHRREAERALLAGDDPRPALVKARAAVARLPETFDPADSAAEIDVATAEVLVAELEAARGSSTEKGASEGTPELAEAIARARKAFTAAAAGAPEDVGYALWLSRVELVDLRRRAALGPVRPEEADAALSPLRPFLERSANGARLHEAAARAIEMKVSLRERFRRERPPRRCAAREGAGGGDRSGGEARGRGARRPLWARAPGSACCCARRGTEADQPREGGSREPRSGGPRGEALSSNPLLARSHGRGEVSPQVERPTARGRREPARPRRAQRAEHDAGAGRARERRGHRRTERGDAAGARSSGGAPRHRRSSAWS
jgi:tetratricopeptide (TPR) repeat protein